MCSNSAIDLGSTTTDQAEVCGVLHVSAWCSVRNGALRTIKSLTNHEDDCVEHYKAYSIHPHCLRYSSQNNDILAAFWLIAFEASTSGGDMDFSCKMALLPTLRRC